MANRLAKCRFCDYLLTVRFGPLGKFWSCPCGQTAFHPPTGPSPHRVPHLAGMGLA